MGVLSQHVYRFLNQCLSCRDPGIFQYSLYGFPDLDDKLRGMNI